MGASRRSPAAVAASFALAALGLDRATKWLIIHLTTTPRAIELTPFLNFVPTRDTSIAFGLFAGSGPTGRWLAVAATALIVAALGAWARRATCQRTAAAIGLVAGGALGNAADRVRLGAVIHFVDLHCGAWHWPTFNVADVAIVTGFCLFVVRRRRATLTGCP